MKFTLPLIACALLAVGCSGGEKTATNSDGAPKGDVKIGFVVKSATEPWFQTEWKFADEAAKEKGFTLVKIPAEDGEKVLAALDNLGAQGAQGVIICTPDVKLGPAIVSKAKENNLKLMSVDDRMIDDKGTPVDAPHLGISAYEIGQTVGQAAVDEMKKRGWKPSDVRVLALTIDALETARERVGGAVEKLKAGGITDAQILATPWKQQDIAGAFDAANVTITQNADVKHWIIISSNDDGVLGGVRATEGRNITAENVIGVGINGTSGVDDLKKPKPTGFFASVLLSPKQHGYGTAMMMYEWITAGKEPPKETFTKGILIDRTNFEAEMKKEGLL